MQEHLEIVAREHEQVNLRIFYSKPAETDIFNKDYHLKGRVNVENFKSILPSNNFDFYMCAPPPMVKDLRNDLAEWGVPKKNIHFEAFGPATVKVCKKESDKESISNISIEFKKSGKTLYCGILNLDLYWISQKKIKFQLTQVAVQEIAGLASLQSRMVM